MSLSRVRVALLPCALLSCFIDGPDATDAASSSAASTSSSDPTGEPAICGNAVLEPGEECDDGPANAIAAACKPDCRASACGDGLLGPGEDCDDANTRDDDTCDSACKSNCGDGKVNEAALEDCEGAGPFTRAMCLQCHFACDAGFGDCTHDDLDPKGNDLGCETDTRTSAAHCGQCGNPCPDGQACVDSACA